MKKMFSLFIYIEAAPSRDVHVFSLSEKSETFYLVTYVGGFSLWKNDNMCQNIYMFFIKIQKIFMFMAHAGLL